MDDTHLNSPSSEIPDTPKPKRTTRKKTVTSSEDLVTLEKPKRTTKKAATVESVESKPKTTVRKTKTASSEAPIPSDEMPKPKRITRRKVASDTESAPSESLTESKPKVVRRTTKKETSITTPEPVSSVPSEDDSQPKILRKSNTQIKKSSSAPEESDQPEQQPHLNSEETSSPRPVRKNMRIQRTSRRPDSNGASMQNKQTGEVVTSLTTNSGPTEIPIIKETVNHPRNEGQFTPREGQSQSRRFSQKNGKFNKNNRFNKKQKNRPQPEEPIELGPPEEINGLLELSPKGFGFIRTPETDFEQSNGATYVPPEIIKKLGLRPCQWIHGLARKTPRGHQLTEVSEINGLSPEEIKTLPHFDELKAINPNKRFQFETTPERYTTRVVDLMSPVGRGQRGLIVAPPRTGKTVLLQHLAEAIIENHKDVHLMILLVDERPEEVTEFKRELPGAEVYASSNDGKVRDHCRLAELCIERAKRLVEAGKDVFILMDSITRLARAYNNANKGTGRTMSGGIDAKALEIPRRLFAAARNTREAGSLTIIATALVETNSRMDELIFQEFKGTGNMELVLNRKIAEQYIYPAVDILKSGTRREELLLADFVLEKVHLIRRALAGHKPIEAIERLLFFLKKYPNNTQMLLDLKQR